MGLINTLTSLLMSNLTRERGKNQTFPPTKLTGSPYTWQGCVSLLTVTVPKF